MKKLLLIAGGLFFIGALLFVTVLFIVDFDFMNVTTVKTISVSKTVSESFTNIKIDTTDCDVSIRLSKDGTCKLEGTTSKKMPFTMKVDDGTLILRQEDQRKWYDHIGIFNGNHAVILYLPQGAYDQCSIHSTTGAISISEDFTFHDAVITCTTGDIKFKAATKNLTADTTTGDISAVNIQTDGQVALKTTTGEIKLQNVVCDTLSAKATTGDIILTDCDGQNISIKTTTGDVKATFLTGKVYDVEVTTGDISVPAQDRTGGDCKVRTTTGDVTITVK